MEKSLEYSGDCYVKPCERGVCLMVNGEMVDISDLVFDGEYHIEIKLTAKQAITEKQDLTQCQPQ